MNYDEEYSEKVNALDLVINVLKDHENRLDELLWKLESIMSRNEKNGETKAQRLETPKRPELHMTRCKEWKEFKGKSRGARRAAFRIEEKILTVDSVTDGEGYRYEETLQVPSNKSNLHIKGCENKNIENVERIIGVFKRKLECGLPASVKSLNFRSPKGEEILVLFYYIDPEGVKGWLSKELGMPDEDIAVGKLIF